MGQDNLYRMKTKVPKTKKRKMDVDEPKQTTEPQVVDVNQLVNKWLLSQKDVCQIILELVNKINEIEKN